MKKSVPFLFVLASLLLLTNLLDAQSRKRRYIKNDERFNAGIVLGINRSQMDGDFFEGFHKSGITGGLRGVVHLSPRLDFNMEMLYSKKGSKIYPGRVVLSNSRRNRIVDLTYIDVPVLFKWMLKDQPKSWHVETGIIYSRLIDTKITEEVADIEREFSYELAKEDFDSNDLAINVGLGYTFANGFAFHFRYAYSVYKFYKNENHFVPQFGSTVQEPVEFLRNYYMTVAISFNIFDVLRK